MADTVGILHKTRLKKNKKAAKLYSMTGYGQAKIKTKLSSIEVEVKSVNSRYLDIAIRLPKSYSLLEPEIRQLISSKIARGRIELTVVCLNSQSASSKINFQAGAFKDLYQTYCQALSKLGIKNIDRQQIALQILTRREILDFQNDTGVDKIEGLAVRKVCELAINDLLNSRFIEGQGICLDLEARINKVSGISKEIGILSQLSKMENFNKLTVRIKGLIGAYELDQARLVNEIAILADRTDISEELQRVTSHINSFVGISAKSPCGKKLEFLMQEFGREFNTIGSKVQDANIQNLVIEAKAEIEKMREQVQNIE